MRRGYFVAGLGAAQFALPGAVDRLRAVRDPPPTTDARRRWCWRPPIRPSRTAPRCRGPSRPVGPPRSAGAFVVLGRRRARRRPRAGGQEPVHLRRPPPTTRTGPRAWSALVKDGRLRKLEIARIDGAPAAESPVADHLRAAGFVDGYKGLTFRLASRP